MSISKITGDLAAGKTTARQHLETCLEAIDSEDGRRAFITVNSDAARAEADRFDRVVLITVTGNDDDFRRRRKPQNLF